MKEFKRAGQNHAFDKQKEYTSLYNMQQCLQQCNSGIGGNRGSQWPVTRGNLGGNRGSQWPVTRGYLGRSRDHDWMGDDWMAFTRSTRNYGPGDSDSCRRRARLRSGRVRLRLWHKLAKPVLSADTFFYLIYLENFLDSRFLIHSNRKKTPQNGYLHTSISVNKKKTSCLGV